MAATLAVAGLLVYVVESRRIDERAVAEAQQELDEFARGLEADTGIGSDLRGTLRLFLQRNVPDADEALIGWVGDAPALGYPPGPLTELRDDPEFLRAAAPLVPRGGSARIEIARGEVLIAAQPARQGREEGAMVVVTLLDEERAALRDTMRTYTIVASLSLLLIVGIAFWQAGRLLAPLRTLRETAEEISGTDLSRRLPLRGNDDITALTRTVNHMLDRLEAAFVGQRQLLDDAGHELRTPLTILQGHLELLDSDDPVEVEETRALLLDEIDRMARLVNDLILLAKTERPDFLDLHPVDVTALTESVLAKASGLGDRTWQLDGVAGTTVLADEQRVTQALLQLAHNAVKHTGPGDVVAIGSVDDGEAVLWWVRDSGPGVPAPDRDRIFERFGRADAADVDGFGLGLSIVRAIARAHGGEAWLDDDHTDGARFVVSVPHRPRTPDPEEA